MCEGASYCAQSHPYQQADPASLSRGFLEAQAPTAGGPWGAGWAGLTKPSSRKRARTSHYVCFSWLWKDDVPQLWWEDGSGSPVPSSREGPSGQVSAPDKFNTTEPVPAPVSLLPFLAAALGVKSHWLSPERWQCQHTLPPSCPQDTASARDCQEGQPLLKVGFDFRVLEEKPLWPFWLSSSLRPTVVLDSCSGNNML